MHGYSWVVDDEPEAQQGSEDDSNFRVSARKAADVELGRAGGSDEEADQRKEDGEEVVEAEADNGDGDEDAVEEGVVVESRV